MPLRVLKILAQPSRRGWIGAGPTGSSLKLPKGQDFCPPKHPPFRGNAWYFTNMPEASSLLNEMLEPVARSLSRDVAEAFVNLRASAAAQKRIADLAERCNQGNLTPS